MDNETEKWNAALEEAMDYFDFHRVAKIMELLDWHWGGDSFSPDIPQMKKCVRSLFKNLSDYKNDACSSGGFRVEKLADSVEISFILESAEGFLEDN